MYGPVLILPAKQTLLALFLTYVNVPELTWCGQGRAGQIRTLLEAVTPPSTPRCTPLGPFSLDFGLFFVGC